MFIYRILNYISSIAVILCILTVGFYVWKAVKSLFRREKLSFADWAGAMKNEILGFAGNISIPLLIISLLATLITNTAIHQLVGIHNLHLKPEGTYCFYVEAHRYGAKTYTLPAQIRIAKETEEVSEGKERTFTYYYIEKVFFSNGGWLEAECDEPVDIGESSSHYDSDTDDEWELTLLNEHAYSPYVTETNNADWLDVVFMLIDVIPIAFSLYILCRREQHYKEES
jgi:hypothetical protein